MKLKHSHGWFAAGPEVARALNVYRMAAFDSTYIFACRPAATTVV